MLKPVDKWIIVVRQEAEETTQGGIVIPAAHREDKHCGIVKGVGAKVEIPIHVGDKIVFGKYAGDHFEEDGIKYMIVKEDEVMAVLVEGGNEN